MTDEAIYCDQAGCREEATVIVQTKRANSGWVVSYWCEAHRPQREEREIAP